jgi:hypothetical protein
VAPQTKTSTTQNRKRVPQGTKTFRNGTAAPQPQAVHKGKTGTNGKGHTQHTQGECAVAADRGLTGEKNTAKRKADADPPPQRSDPAKAGERQGAMKDREADSLQPRAHSGPAQAPDHQRRPRPRPTQPNHQRKADGLPAAEDMTPHGQKAEASDTQPDLPVPPAPKPTEVTRPVTKGPARQARARPKPKVLTQEQLEEDRLEKANRRLESRWLNRFNELTFASTGERSLTPDEVQALMAQYPRRRNDLDEN